MAGPVLDRLRRLEDECRATDSAAGVIALSKVREVSFMSYLRFFPALLLAYSVGYLGAYWLGGQVTNTPVTLVLSSLG